MLLPLLWEAVVSSKAFAAHQRQRRAAGLAPERGVQVRGRWDGDGEAAIPCSRGRRVTNLPSLQAWICTQVWELCGNTEGGLTMPPLLLGWILLAVAWDWTAFLTASSR